MADLKHAMRHWRYDLSRIGRGVVLIGAACFQVLSCVRADEAADSMTGTVVSPTVSSEQEKANPQTDKETHPMILIQTTRGPIKIELYPDKAPVTVANFLRYVDERFYNGTIFHRVIPDFVIQGGGFTRDLQQKTTREPIPNEATNGLSNRAGTVAMARTPEVHSATSQFFINLRDNLFLDHTAPNSQGFGYCVFGRVVEGMEVVNEISRVPATTRGHMQNVPVDPVEILSIQKLP